MNRTSRIPENRSSFRWRSIALAWSTRTLRTCAETSKTPAFCCFDGRYARLAIFHQSELPACQRFISYSEVDVHAAPNRDFADSLSNSVRVEKRRPISGRSPLQVRDL